MVSGQGFAGSSFSKNQVWIRVNVLKRGLHNFRILEAKRGCENQREDDLKVKVVVGGKAPISPCAASTTYTDPSHNGEPGRSAVPSSVWRQRSRDKDPLKRK